jgi:hypothetical protein
MREKRVLFCDEIHTCEYIVTFVPFFPKISLTHNFSLNLYLNAKRFGGYIIKYVYTAQDYSIVYTNRIQIFK